MEKIKISIHNLYKNNINYNIIGGAQINQLQQERENRLQQLKTYQNTILDFVDNGMDDFFNEAPIGDLPQSIADEYLTDITNNKEYFYENPEEFNNDFNRSEWFDNFLQQQQPPAQAPQQQQPPAPEQINPNANEFIPQAQQPQQQAQNQQQQAVLNPQQPPAPEQINPNANEFIPQAQQPQQQAQNQQQQAVLNPQQQAQLNQQELQLQNQKQHLQGQKLYLDFQKFEAENYNLAQCRNDVINYRFYNLRNQIQISELATKYNKNEEEIKDLLKNNNFDFVQVEYELNQQGDGGVDRGRGRGGRGRGGRGRGGRGRGGRGRGGRGRGRGSEGKIVIKVPKIY